MKRLRQREATGRWGNELGMNLVEVLSTVGIIGVLSAIALVIYKNTFDGTEDVIAQENVERLNSAVWKYNQIKELIPIAGDDGSKTDEEQVIALLQTRDGINMPGSPYLPSQLSFDYTDDDTKYRLLWNGKAFEMAGPGTTGNGIKVDF